MRRLGRSVAVGWIWVSLACGGKAAPQPGPTADAGPTLDAGDASAKPDAPEPAPPPTDADAAAAAPQAPPALAPQAADLFEKPALAERRRPGLELIEPGVEPRRTIAIAPALGIKTVLAARLELVLAVAVGSREVPPTDIPLITVDTIAEVTAVDDKQITIAISTQNAAASPSGIESDRVRSAVAEAVTDLGAARATVTIDRSGGPTLMAMEGAADTTRMQPSLDGFFDTIRPLFVAVPRAAVGVGAVWEAVSQREEAGALMQQIVRYEIVALDDEILHVRWRAERGVLSIAPSDGAGIEAHGATGKGEAKFDLRAGAPRSGAAEINSRTHARVKFGETPSPVMVQQVSTLELGAKL